MQSYLRLLGALSFAALSAACAGTALAQTYPAQPVRIIVPFPPGNSADVAARLVASTMADQTGKSFIVENVAGAGGTVGTGFVTRQPPDGYVLLLLAIGPISQAPAIYPKLPYDPLRDLAVIGTIAQTPMVLAANAKAGINSVQDLIDKAKAAPGAINFASSGVGSNQHITMELLKARTGIDITHIPYKGGSEAVTATLAGDTTVEFDAIPPLIAHAQSGKLKLLAVSTAQRSPALPDVPTVAEAGVPGFDAVGWMGLGAPAGTPPAVLDFLGSQLRKALADPAVVKKLTDMSLTPFSQSRQDSAAFVKETQAKWTAVIQQANIKVD